MAFVWLLMYASHLNVCLESNAICVANMQSKYLLETLRNNTIRRITACFYQVTQATISPSWKVGKNNNCFKNILIIVLKLYFHTC